ncbi:DUF4397 domain-containing protein [Sphingobacterium sp. lm-10]|uniref:DUF4397 domain-containing protein n=1 Tax=Sphingobacterium sp. lm-10 TaxID=2944904 RepID=UPI0020200938|nr:DUF4397 domain-containing protein [Sphingobacterium sp. lm-10]MCL7986868.1 DUF4397 domain-containing protein [Sphingobacterium sp. lm-10]
MKKTVKLLLLLTVIVLANSCLKDDSVRQPFAVLTVINGYTAEPRLTFALDRNNFHTGNYTTAQSYDIAIGNRAFSYRGAAAQNLVDTTFQIVPSTFYSAFAYGTPSDPKVLLTKDSAARDLGARAAVRFIHLANDVDAVQLYLGEQPVEGIAMRTQETASSVNTSQVFVPITAGNNTFTVKDSAGDVLATSRNISMNSGMHRTLILWGTRGNEATPLRLVSY